GTLITPELEDYHRRCNADRERRTAVPRLPTPRHSAWSARFADAMTYVPGGADVRSFAAWAPASSTLMASWSGSLCQVPGPQSLAKRRIKTSRGEINAVRSISSSAVLALPSRRNETLSTTSRRASTAMAALARFEPPSRRTLLFVSPTPEERSERKLTTTGVFDICAN